MFGLSSFSPPSPGQVKLYGRTISALSVRHQSSVADLDYIKKKLYMEQSVQPDFLLNYSTGRIQTVKSGRVGKILPMWPNANHEPYLMGISHPYIPFTEGRVLSLAGQRV